MEQSMVDSERNLEYHEDGPNGDYQSDLSNGLVVDYSRFFTQLAKNRQLDPLGVILDQYNPCPEDLVSFAGGLPNPELAPFKVAHLQLKDGTNISLDEQNMDECMQYGKTQGYYPLLVQLRALVQHYHQPLHWHQRDVMVTLGCQDAIAKVVEAMVNIGDYVIVPEPCYSGTLALLSPYTPRYLRIACDEEGIRADSLRQELSRWSPEEVRHACHGIPKVLYVNPCCNNPLGGSLSHSRRQEIYGIACEYDLIILEDDPYYFLHFDGVLGVTDTKSLLDRRALKHKVLLLPGVALLCPKDGDHAHDHAHDHAPYPASPFLRASFSTASPSDIDLGIKRFAAMIREELQAKREEPKAAQKEGNL